MADDQVLYERQTAWVRGATDTKLGRGILTRGHLLFYDTKFMPGVAGGALGVAIGESLQKRHEEGGPMLSIALDTLTGIERQKKMLNKDRILLRTADGEYLFNDGWKDWSPILRETLTATYGRRVTEQGPDSWRVDRQ